MRKTVFLFGLWYALGWLPGAVAQTPWERERGRMRSDIVGVKEASPESVVRLYGESHALVIGMSAYRHPYWSRLEGARRDFVEVSRALDEHGFLVEPALDLTAGELMARLEDFIARHGAAEQNRLIIYYAGHGYKTDSGAGGREEGYIVPVDAPAPGEHSPVAFTSAAINMSRIMALAAKIKSKHTLLALDSCFSGSLLNAAQSAAGAGATPDAPSAPASRAGGYILGGVPSDPGTSARSPLRIPHSVSTNAQERAHLFITSGTDKQSVPDDSEFARRFVQALTDESGAGADLNGDSYVMGTELGSYLYDNVTENSRGRQRPRSGFLGGQATNPGDFIFILPGAYAKEVGVLGPAVEPEVWELPPNWGFVKEKGRHRLLAGGRGLALPKDLVRHSFHDVVFVTRLRLTNNAAAGFVVRAQGPEDYYLVRITGNNARAGDEKFTAEAFAVKGGQRFRLKDSPLKIDHPDVKLRLNREGLIQVEIEASGSQLLVRLSAAEGNGSGFPLLTPLVFTDEKQTFRYGAAGYLAEDREQFKIEGISIGKLRRKGRVLYAQVPPRLSPLLCATRAPINVGAAAASRHRLGAGD